MPRAPRLQVAGGLYHLGTRGVRRERIYRTSGDYELFGCIFGRVVERFDWHCHSYCLMPNHYHLLVETKAPNLSAGMQRLNSIYAVVQPPVRLYRSRLREAVLFEARGEQL